MDSKRPSVQTIGDADLSQMSVDVPVILSGQFTNPKIQVNTQNAIQSLTTQIIQAQKEKATNTIKDKIGDEINKFLGGGKRIDSTKTDSTKTKEEMVKDKVKDIFGGFTKKKKNN